MPSQVANAPLNKANRFIYNSLFRRNSVFLFGVFAGAFAFELAFDRAIDAFWDRNNKGVGARPLFYLTSYLEAVEGYRAQVHPVIDRWACDRINKHRDLASPAVY